MGRISALTELTSLASNDYLIVLDSSANIAKKITVANAFGIPDFGYTATGETWTYASATTITVPSNATTKYNVGNIVKITQTTGGTKYGIIITVASTLLTIFWLNGATLANEAITSPFYSPSATPLGVPGFPTLGLHNNVKFSAYYSAGNTSANTFSKVNFDAELFDTGSNFSSGRFTAPVAGFYFFSSTYGNTAAGSTAIHGKLYKNGASVKGGSYAGTNTAGGAFSHVSGLLQLAAGDYVELYFIGGNGSTGSTGVDNAFFDGFLMSRT